MIDVFIDITLLAFLAITAVAIVRITNLFAVVMLFGVFSLLSAGLFVVMDAPDVAFTEAAVGAGISTVLMLATLALVRRSQKPYYAEAPRAHRPWLPLIVVTVTGSALVYGTWDIPGFGAPDAPAQTHVARYYIENALSETGRAGELSRLRYPGRSHGDLYRGRGRTAVARWATLETGSQDKG